MRPAMMLTSPNFRALLPQIRFMAKVNQTFGVKKTMGAPDRPICQDIWYSGQVLDAVKWPDVINNPKVQARQGELGARVAEVGSGEREGAGAWAARARGRVCMCEDSRHLHLTATCCHTAICACAQARWSTSRPCRRCSVTAPSCSPTLCWWVVGGGSCASR